MTERDGRAMGTYDDSKYVKTRKARDCDRCGARINVGDRHLAYKLGLYSTIHVCEACSRESANNGKPYYWCREVEAERAGESP